MTKKKARKEMPSEKSLSLMPVDRNAIKEMKAQRALMKEFIQSQLVEADFSEAAEKNGSYGEGDYGVIPGTKKRCLFKPGAEKLLRLFQLGVRLTLVDKEVDREGNYAAYTYRAEIYSPRQGFAFSQCEGICNSHEKKYKTRTVWTYNKEKKVRESQQEDTPIYDILNTLQKMAQKRAIVGATLLATAASDYFTQDMLDADDFRPPKKEEPKDVTPPQESSAASTAAPVHCGKQMILSKYVDKDMGHAPWYCMSCKAKVAAQ